jgi:outer membrane biogenesis lipoprotein LolB
LLAGKPGRGGFVRPRLAALALLVQGIIPLISCLPTRPSFAPLPSKIESIEGYASFRITREGASAKSRLTFVFRLPDQGRIEVSDPLGRTVSLLIFGESGAFFVLPAKKTYWQATREEVMSKLLGFDLSPEELTDLLSGYEEHLSGWVLDRDGRDRVTGGRRGEVRFEVRRFFQDGRLPQSLYLAGAGNEGSLRILRLSFNQPQKKDAFRPIFLESGKYAAVSWAEIEEWLHHEN